MQAFVRVGKDFHTHHNALRGFLTELQTPTTRLLQGERENVRAPEYILLEILD